MLDNESPGSGDTAMDKDMLRTLFRTGAVWDSFKEIQEDQVDGLSSFKDHSPAEAAEMVKIMGNISRLLVSESTRLIERVSFHSSRVSTMWGMQGGSRGDEGRNMKKRIRVKNQLWGIVNVGFADIHNSYNIMCRLIRLCPLMRRIGLVSKMRV